MQRQRDALEAVAGCFDACRFSVEAPRRLIEMAHL
jgi:hypothetical protein